MSDLTSFFIDSDGKILWVSVGGVAFAVLFFLGGVSRIVEFSGIGFTKLKVRLLSALHIIGCFFLSAALVTISTDRFKSEKGLSLSLLVAALILFAPGQVMIALIRRKHTAPRK